MLKTPFGFATCPDRDRPLTPTERPARGELPRALAGFLLATLVLRGATLGYPMLHIDEQFYLLVGDRMLHGAVPYVDIWDRKPVGLFVIYAAIRLLGGLGVVQYQLVAALCAAVTALTIYRMARMIAPAPGAFWAGVGYLLYLSAYQCMGGQAPVFFNLPMALAGLILCHLVARGPRARLMRGGLGVMALVGLSLQIKYTVLFEGLGFGLMLMALGLRQGWRWPGVLGAGALWAATALVPTAMVLGYYTAIHQQQAFVYANFQSIFARTESMDGALARLIKEMATLLPVWLAIALAPRLLPRPPHQDARVLTLLRLWGAVAVLGFLAFGVWYDHYVAPLLVPLMVLAAPALGRRGAQIWFTVALVLVSACAAIGVTTYSIVHHGTRAQIEDVARIIDHERQGACIYINEGDPILYQYTGACIVTPYIFPNHLNGLVDFNALGIDGMAEVRRIMAQRPRVVVMTSTPSSLPPNWPVRRAIQAMLDRDYALVSRKDVGWRTLLIYRLSDPRKIG